MFGFRKRSVCGINADKCQAWGMLSKFCWSFTISQAQGCLAALPPTLRRLTRSGVERYIVPLARRYVTLLRISPMCGNRVCSVIIRYEAVLGGTSPSRYGGSTP